MKPSNHSIEEFYKNMIEEVAAHTRFNWQYVFFSITLLGILANIFVLLKKKNTSKRQSTATKTSLFLLCTMAASDTLCLVGLLFMLSLRYIDIRNELFLNIVCKLDLFIIHTTSSFSIWCWLVLSAVRYMAVYRPYTHLRLNKEPRLAVISLAIFCSVMESWVLYDIKFDTFTNSCMSSSEPSLSKKLQISEIVVSYFLPFAILTVLDMKVLLCRVPWGHKTSRIIHRNSSEDEKANSLPSMNTVICESGKIIGGMSKMASFDEPTLKRIRSKKRMQQMRVLRRCLCITIFDLLMNLPNYLLRLYLTVISEEEYMNLNMAVFGYIENISQIMYFAQFALNAFYLVCIIYDAPKNREKTPLSTQISSAYYSLSPRSMSKKSFRIRGESVDTV